MTSSISGKVIARYAPELLKWMLSGTAGSVHTITWATLLVILAVYASMTENRSPAEFSALCTLEVSTRVKICGTKDLIHFCFMMLWLHILMKFCILRTECWIFWIEIVLQTLLYLCSLSAKVMAIGTRFVVGCFELFLRVRWLFMFQTDRWWPCSLSWNSGQKQCGVWGCRISSCCVLFATLSMLSMLQQSVRVMNFWASDNWEVLWLSAKICRGPEKNAWRFSAEAV